MKVPRYSYKNYKDDRDCLTKKVINRVMYMIYNEKKKPLISKDGSMMIFYKFRLAMEYSESNREGREWRIKKVRLDITTL